MDGDAAAYPLRVLMWHETSTTASRASPLAVTYCPLCTPASSSIGGSKGPGGETIAPEFGTTG